MFQNFKMLHAQRIANQQQSFEQTHQPQIDYIVDGPKYTDINHLQVFTTEDATWDTTSTMGKPNQIRRIIQLSDNECTQLIEYWYQYYRHHRWLLHHQYQRALHLYQHYQNQ